MRLKHIPTMDKDEFIPRSPGNGFRPNYGEVSARKDLTADRFPETWSKAFNERVQSARVMLRKGTSAREIQERHGAIVLRQAAELEKQVWP